MPIIQVLRVAVAAVLSLVALILVFYMFTAEKNTGEIFTNYFKWAEYAGLIFIAIGAALTAIDKEDRVVTDFEEEASSK